MAKIVMGYWDCPNCGRTVKGTLRSCPGCNAPRGADVKFYTKDVEYLSEEEAAKIGSEPDWLCDYCGTYNNAKDGLCKSCNAPRSNSTKDYFEQNTDKERAHAKDESKWECAYCGAQNDADADHCNYCKAERCEKPKEEPKPQPVKKKVIWPWVLLFIAIIVAGAFLLRSKTKDATLTVNSISYTSKVFYEELALRELEADDRSAIPSNGTFLRTETREKSVPVITLVDQGNGTFEEVTKDEKQEVTVYIYTVEGETEWKEVKIPLEYNGQFTKGESLIYPVLSSQQREKNKEVTYHVDATDSEGKSKKYYVTETNKGVMDKIQVGGTYNFKVNGSRIMSVE